jgi:hypothetical protein
MGRTAFGAAVAGCLATSLAACSSDSTGPSGLFVPTECRSVDLAPGENAFFEGASVVDCLALSDFEEGATFEVVVSSMSRTLGFSPMELRIVPGDDLRAPGVASAGSRAAAPSASATGAEAAWRTGQSAMDARMRSIEGSILPQIRMTANAVSGGLFQVPAIGSRLTYDLSCVSSSEYPNAPGSVEGIVRHVSNRAVIVEDVQASSSFSAEEYRQIGAAFDDVIYDTDVEYFGEPADIDGNGGRVILLYTAGVNRLSDDYSSSFIAGFFCPLDLGSSAGNRAEMFYLMVPDADGEFTDAAGDGISKEQVRRITDNTVAHELQHLINAQRGRGGAQDVWLNEGLSHLAEELVGHAVNGFKPGTALGSDQLMQSEARLDVFNKYYLNNWFNLSQYLRSPADTAALLNARDPLDLNTFRMRGASWSFVRYLLDRFETTAPGQAARVRALIASSARDSRDAVEQVFGQPFETLATQWSMMLVSAGRDDVEAAAELQFPSYRLREVFESRIGLAVNPPSGGFPLKPIEQDLLRADTLDARLFTATSLYIELSAAQAGSGARIELVRAGTGAALAEGVEPRLHILRIR